MKIRQQPISLFFFDPQMEIVEQLHGFLQFPRQHIQPDQHGNAIKYQFDPASCFRLHHSLVHQCNHFLIITAFFQKTFRQSQIHQPFAVISQHQADGPPNGFSHFFVLFAPPAEVFSAIHYGRQITGHRKLRYGDFLIHQKSGRF